MKYFLLVVTLLGSVGLTACAVHTREGSIVVDPEGRLNDGRYYDGHGNGRFCPPGQAKKGNC
ncbi:hypothetical protein LF296_12415 [Acinetobacter vivianii]|jgi:hypothetical protein|uniref:Lipoprotein n=2 Tax=Acinetobacter TaxID=469 RepID=N9PVT0_9GAMM|nr:MULTISPECIES: hypothetical protein [Acinetobacter]RSN81639.1 hypothetical protein EA770_11075 [Acinetobacter baumannii]ENU90945.1 hypothetical protein F971_03412 [Acinetobacter vivianii]ENX23276.1 hypothetical protein F892_02523 [Acinetobacter vivianii]ENX37588.1 hypothetical protein F888_02929 [Acinetobacter courvalinii]KAB0658928.1 hypothetical protein F7P77_14760 [Acinetobacter courvalinii]